MDIKNLTEEVYRLHDVTHNQKYAELFPYSYHLKMVEKQFHNFKHLIPDVVHTLIQTAIVLHDIIEDVGYTYNNVKSLLAKHNYSKRQQELIAEIVYCVTDEKGRNRAERKNDKFYSELSQNHYATFVKLCDVSANTLFSKANGSSMYGKYKKEFPKFKEKVYNGKYEELFTFVETI